MARRILVPIDGSTQAYGALEYAASEHPDATFVALTVSNPSDVSTGATEMGMAGYADEWMEIEEQRAEERFERAVEIADEHGVSLETESVFGRPARAIVEFAEEHDVDAIVMGSHGRDGVSRILLGSVAETVIRRSPCPVTVVR
jgi:nucleotide-binding universal stress UspA family protein